ncbi:hypothetical protein GCK32_016962, partial [Trichostrongylus colubriformis]
LIPSSTCKESDHIIVIPRISITLDLDVIDDVEGANARCK